MRTRGRARPSSSGNPRTCRLSGGPLGRVGEMSQLVLWCQLQKFQLAKPAFAYAVRLQSVPSSVDVVDSPRLAQDELPRGGSIET